VCGWFGCAAVRGSGARRRRGGAPSAEVRAPRPGTQAAAPSKDQVRSGCTQSSLRRPPERVWERPSVEITERLGPTSLGPQASDPQRSHWAWQRQQSRWLNKHGSQQALPLQTPQALSLSSSSTRAMHVRLSKKSTYSPSIPADTTKCTRIAAFLWIGCPITTRPVATSPSFASGELNLRGRSRARARPKRSPPGPQRLLNGRRR